MDTTREQVTIGVLQEVQVERYRQEDKWGQQDHRDERWLAILVEEVGEAAESILGTRKVKFQEFKELRKELLQIAAVAVAWIEAWDRAMSKELV